MIFRLDGLRPLDKQYYLQHVVAPRPICFASTIDLQGNMNLSPFSFFNIFSANPPVVIFSPARRLRDNTVKHTLQNVQEVPEVVINVVSYDMVQQVSLASCEYAKGVDEFTKAGFTKEPATLIKPAMVKESKAKLECKVLEIKSLGQGGGAGQLVICEVLVLHLDDCLLDTEKKIDPSKLDFAARLGGDWYCRISSENLFTVPKPVINKGIGFDLLPEHIRSGSILDSSHLAQLAGAEALPLPDPEMLDQALAWCLKQGLSPQNDNTSLHRAARYLIEKGRIDWAWQVLLQN